MEIGLNREQFVIDYANHEIEMELQHEIQFTRRAGVATYPSLRLQIEKQFLPITIDYNNAQVVLEQIRPYIK